MGDKDFMVDQILKDLKRQRGEEVDKAEGTAPKAKPEEPFVVEAADVPIRKDEIEWQPPEPPPFVHKEKRTDPKALPDNEQSKAFIEAFLRHKAEAEPPKEEYTGALDKVEGPEEQDDDLFPNKNLQRTVPISVVIPPREEPAEEEPEERPKKKKRFGRKKQDDTAVFTPPALEAEPLEEAEEGPMPPVSAEPAPETPEEPDEGQLSFLEEDTSEEDVEEKRKKRIMDFILTPEEPEEEEAFDIDERPDDKEEEETIEISEFTSYDQADAIKNDMAATTAKLFVRMLLLLIPAAVSVYSLLATKFTLPFGTYFSPAEPAVFAFLHLVLLGFSAAVCLFTILSGLGSFFQFKANADSMVSIAVLAGLLYNAFLFYNLDALSKGALPVYTAVLVFSLFFNTLGKFLIVRRMKRNFSFVAKKDEKFGCIKVGDKASELIEEYTNIDGVNAYAQYRTGFIKNFLKNSYMTDYSDRISKKTTQIFFWLSVAIAAYSFYKTKDVVMALGTLSAATAVTAPFTSLLISNWPLSRLSKVLRRFGAIITGYNVVEELEKVDVVIAEDRDVLPAGTVKLHGFKPFGQNKPDDLIIYAASVMGYLNNSLSDVFNLVIQGNSKLLMNVESVNASDLGGVEAWVGGRRIHLGSRDYMASHDMAVPSKDYESKYLKPGRVAFYMAVSGEVAAMFVVSYNPREEIVKAANKLAKSGVMLLVKTTDPNVNSYLLSELFGISREFVDVLPVMIGQMVDKQSRSAESTDSGFVHKGSFESLAYGIISVIKLKWTILLGAVLQTLGCVLGLALCIFFTVAGTLSGIEPLMMLLFEGLFLLITILLQRLKV